MTAAAGDAAALASALCALGFSCDVEPRVGLALIRLRTDDAGRLAASPDRALVLALAKEHGFSHVAVEVGADRGETGAAVLRD